MRVRLQVDVDWPEELITNLGVLATEQTPVHVIGIQEGAGLFLSGRIMGATSAPVEVTATDAEH
jgi:hypothetical protein